MQRQKVVRPDDLSNDRLDLARCHQVGGRGHFRLGGIAGAEQTDLSEDEIPVLDRYGLIDKGREDYESAPRSKAVHGPGADRFGTNEVDHHRGRSVGEETRQ